MARVPATISLSDDERAELEALSPSQDVAGALIVLAAAEGLENKEIAVREASADTVGCRRLRRRASTVCTTNPAPARRVGDDAIAF